jgi:hypothetical protein
MTHIRTNHAQAATVHDPTTSPLPYIAETLLLRRRLPSLDSNIGGATG